MTRKPYKNLYEGIIKDDISPTNIINEAGVREITDWADLGTGTEDGELVAYSDGTNKAIFEWDNANSRWLFSSSGGEFVLIEDWSNSTLNSNLWDEAQDSISSNSDISINTSLNRVEVNIVSGQTDRVRLLINAFKCIEETQIKVATSNTTNSSVTVGSIGVNMGFSYSSSPVSSINPRFFILYKRVCCTSNQYELRYIDSVGSNTTFDSTNTSNTSDKDIIISSKRFIEEARPNTEYYSIISGASTTYDSEGTYAKATENLSGVFTPHIQFGNFGSNGSGTMYIGKIYIKR